LRKIHVGNSAEANHRYAERVVGVINLAPPVPQTRFEDHIREHIVDPAAPDDDPRTQAAEELVEIIHSYLT